MDRDSLDLNGLSRSFVRNSVIVSHAGVDQTFSVYQHALVSHFSRNSVVWKINGKPFPHRLIFPLKFVPYEDKLCFGPHISPTEITKIAYLHIFNINVTSADDYRSNVRHNVSDWFAKLNSKSDVQWAIVINTTRAKDRKTKSAIMEKIKSDFAKYTSRLFELPDTTDQTAFGTFVQGIQQFLFAHLSLIIEIWDKSLKTAYERRKQHTWEPFAYFSSMTEYARVFWSFGAIEYSISIFDDLEQLLHEFVLRSTESESPKWVSQLLNIKIEDRPSLIANFALSSIQKKEAHYLGMRNHLLCQQIVMAVHLYQHKMKSNDAAPSLRSDCAVGILKRALVTIDAVKEFNALMNNKRDVAATCCWTWWTVSESLSICQLLCDISHLNIAPLILSRLQLARFDALFTLAKQLKLNPNDSVQLDSWLRLKENSESILLRSALSSTEKMCFEMERAHDVCSAALIHSNRLRIALHTTNRLFVFLKSVNAKCPTFKLTRNALDSLPVEPTTSLMLKTLCEDILDSDASGDDVLALAFFLTQCENGNDKESNERFLKKCATAGRVVDLNSLTNNAPFTVQIENFEAVQTTDSVLEVRCRVDSMIGFSLENAKVSLNFSRESTSSIVQTADLSVLSLQHEKKENVCRLVSELKLNRQSQTNSDENDDHKFVVCTESVIISPGINNVTFCTDISKIGCFVLETVSISTNSIRYETSNVITRRPAVLYCISTPHSVTVVNETQHFFAGVLQNLDIEVQAMCDIPRETTLEIDASNQKFQFLDKNHTWNGSLSLTLQPFRNQEKRTIEVKMWLTIDSSICESAAVQKRSLLVKWMNRRYNLSLNFVPVMVVTSKTSMLTTDILLEVELNRAAGANIITIIESASLTTEPSNDTETAEVASPLTQFPIESGLLSIVNMIWKLPLCGSQVKHRLHVEYVVKDESPSIRYSFDDVVELTVPDVQLEICTQVLSQQPGAQLCRATSPCHFVISIRYLKEMPCTLLVVLDADDRMWTLVERTKMVTVKDSGLGQLALTIIPVIAGFLPFPNVSIYECQLVSESIIPGNEILCFNRTAGKQIRVLSPTNSDNNNFGKDESTRGSNRIAKKIVKLFD